MSLFCENFKALLTTVNDGERWLVRARCKQWTCAYCARVNAKVWQARIIKHVNNHDLQWSWFTLTAHSKKQTPETSLKNLRSAWEALVKRIKRKFKQVEKVHYVRVYERHKSGAYHLHCIISVHFDDIRIRTSKKGKKTSYSAWLAKAAKDLKIGYYTHAANFDGHHAGYIAGYVAKYMTKQTPEDSRRVRMIQASQGWTNEKLASDYNWRVWNNYTVYDLKLDLANCVDVIDLSTGNQLSYDDFLQSDYYPPDETDTSPDIDKFR